MSSRTTRPAMPQRSHVVAETIPTTFNAITIDGCMSTSDTVLLFANGSAGIDVSGSEAFTHAVRDLMADLAYQVVADGEGATRVIRSVVKGAASSEDASLGAQEIARSDLLRSAIGATTPTSRIVQAWVRPPRAGPFQVDVSMAGILLLEVGLEGQTRRSFRSTRPGGDAIVEADSSGEAEFEYLSCDLTPEYVKFNADTRHDEDDAHMEPHGRSLKRLRTSRDSRARSSSSIRGNPWSIPHWLHLSPATSYLCASSACVP